MPKGLDPCLDFLMMAATVSIGRQSNVSNVVPVTHLLQGHDEVPLERAQRRPGSIKLPEKDRADG